MSESIPVSNPMDLQFYRTRAAVRIKLMYPKIRPGSTYPSLGGFMFNFAQSASEGSNKYNWDNQITFFLSAAEVGGFVDALERNETLAIYHDPDKGSSNEGTRAKTLAFNTGSGTFLNISMGETRIGIALSAADVRQICLLLGHSLRLCYGWY